MSTFTTSLPCYVSDLQLAHMHSVSRATIWRWAKAGILPPPIRLSAGCTRWKMADIEQLRGAAE